MTSTPETEDHRMERLYQRSNEFEAALAAYFSEDESEVLSDDPRYERALSACLVSNEHGYVIRMAFAAGSPISGAALLRLQYEALLRGAWLCYAATPDEVRKLAQPLDIEAEQDAKKLPGPQEMLIGVERGAPEGLAVPLKEFNLHHRHALNSYVHSGIHPLHRNSEGFPLELALNLIRVSNGLLHMAYRMMASLVGSQSLVDLITQMHSQFEECLPSIAPLRGVPNAE